MKFGSFPLSNGEPQKSCVVRERDIELSLLAIVSYILVHQQQGVFVSLSGFTIGH